MRSSERNNQRIRGNGSALRTLWHVAPFITIAAIAVVIMVVVVAAGGRIVSTVAGQGGGGRSVAPALAQHPCGFPGKPACPTAQKQWIPLPSTSSADVVAAARRSDFFGINSAGKGDTPSLAHLGDAQLVLAMRGAGVDPSAAPNYFDIPILTATNAPLGVVLCEVNSTNSAIAVVAIVQYAQPRATGALARLDQGTALAALTAQHHTTLRAGAQAQLVYLPTVAMAQQTGRIIWVAGGASPDDPIWAFPGADGQQHVVGDDGHVYFVSELPVNAQP